MCPFLTPEQRNGPAEVGGKAAGLGVLHELEAPVPPWVVLPAGAAVAVERLPEIFRRLDGGAGVAVRSSAQSEDGAVTSQAGAYATQFCDGPEGLAKAIDAVRESGPPTADSSDMAVVIQQRIDALVSGVLFSAHPSNAHPDRAYVESVSGAPGKLVDGVASPHSAWLEPFSGVMVDGEVAESSILTGAVLGTLCTWLRRAEEALGRAVDIEWAVDGEGLWLLQLRPVTRFYLDRSLGPPVAATSWFFDQRFSRPLTPLTRSALLPRIVEAGIVEALGLCGKTPPEPLVYDYGGQVYVAHAAYADLLGGVPSRWLTKDLAQLFPEERGAPKYFPGPGVFWAGLSLLWQERRNALVNRRAWRGYCARLDVALAAIPDASGEDVEEWGEAWEALDQLTMAFLRIHRWSIALADGGFGVFCGVTAKLPARWRAALHHRLQARVRLITLEANRAKEEGSLAAYGHRSASLDYGDPTWSEASGAHRLPTMPTLDALRGRPEARGGLARLLEMREEQRFVWEMILARQRRLALRAADTLCAREQLAHREEVFWLKVDELLDGLAGKATPSPSVIAQRQRHARVYRAVSRPTHLSPGDEVALPDAGGSAQSFTGIGASTGTARGRAVVLEPGGDVAQVDGGDILVLPCLDPAATAVMGRVAGLVIERGGLLSHAAIVAREYGVPLVIGVPDIVSIVRTGELLRIDGERGVVVREG